MPYRAWLCALLIGSLGCATDPPGSSSEDTSSTDSGTTTGDEPCISQNTVELIEFEVETLGNGVEVSSCTVTTVEHDAQDPTRWTFEFECFGPGRIVLSLDPPLETAPFQVGDELTGIVGDATIGEVFRILELQDPSGRVLLAVFDYLGFPDAEIQQPTSEGNPFMFEWTPDPDCETIDEPCDIAYQLRLDASAGGDVLTLDPSQRYGVLVEPPDSGYGLWVGDSWIGGCDGESTRALRYALVALP